MTERLYAAIVTTVLLSLVATQSNWAEPAVGDTVGVPTIIEKYIKASGGPALNEIRTEQRKGTLLRYQFGPVPMEITTKAPGLWRYDQTFAWGDQVSYGFDGSQVWVVDIDDVEAPFPGYLGEFQIIVDPQAPLKLTEWYPEMSVAGEKKIGDKEVATVLARSAEGRATELAFDRATGLLVQAGQVRFEDYKQVGDLVRPHKILIGENDSTGFQMVFQFTDIRHDEPLDDAFFRQPECVLTGAEAPLYTHRTKIELDIPALEACVGVYQHPIDSSVTYTVSRKGTHLMLERTGWGMQMEIMPESDTHFFTKFINRDYYFLTDANGRVTHLQIGNDGTFKANRIK